MSVHILLFQELSVRTFDHKILTFSVYTSKRGVVKNKLAFFKLTCGYRADNDV